MWVRARIIALGPACLSISGCASAFHLVPHLAQLHPACSSPKPASGLCSSDDGRSQTASQCRYGDAPFVTQMSASSPEGSSAHYACQTNQRQVYMGGGRRDEGRS